MEQNMAFFLEVTSRAAGRRWFAMGLNFRALSWDRTLERVVLVAG